MLGRVPTVSSNASISRRRWITVTGDIGNPANVEGERIVLTETDELKAMQSGPQPVPTPKSLVGKL